MLHAYSFGNNDYLDGGKLRVEDDLMALADASVSTIDDGETGFLTADAQGVVTDAENNNGLQVREKELGFRVNPPGDGSGTESLIFDLKQEVKSVSVEIKLLFSVVLSNINILCE